MKEPVIIRSLHDLARALHQRRDERGHTLRGLAHRIGTGPGMVSAWENGHRVPNGSSLLRLAHALGYDLALIPREDA